MWTRREIENYIVNRRVLIAFAGDGTGEDLFGLAEREKRIDAMERSIDEVSQALITLGKPAAFSDDVKASDDFLDPLFRAFFGKLGLPIALRKTDYHRLAWLLAADEIPPEVGDKLDRIVAIANAASKP